LAEGPTESKPSEPQAGATDDKTELEKLNRLAPLVQTYEKMERRLSALEARIVAQQKKFYRVAIQGIGVFATIVGTILVAGNAAIQLPAQSTPGQAFHYMIAILGALFAFCVGLILMLGLIVWQATRAAPELSEGNVVPSDDNPR
jgi:hypothetical protein